MRPMTVCRMGSFASAGKNKKRTYCRSARSLLAKSSDFAVIRSLSSDCVVNIFCTLTFSSIFRTTFSLIFRTTITTIDIIICTMRPLTRQSTR